jgi:hypothetical protein
VSSAAISAIGEIVRTVGIIATLLYLAFQVRASARASAVEAKLQSARLLSDFTDLLIQSPELNAIFRRGRKSADSLSSDDHFRFSSMCLKAFWFFSAGHFQFRRGSISEDDWWEFKAIVRYWLRGQGVREWWEKFGRTMYGRDFVSFIDSEIAKIDTA